MIRISQWRESHSIVEQILAPEELNKSKRAGLSGQSGIQVGKLTISVRLTVCFYHVTYAFQSESTLYSCLNVKELLARSRRKI